MLGFVLFAVTVMVSFIIAKIHMDINELDEKVKKFDDLNKEELIKLSNEIAQLEQELNQIKE